MRHGLPSVLGQRVYISLAFLGLFFFSPSYPKKPCASLAVVAVALLWPGAHGFLSPELAVGFLKDGIIPALWLQTRHVLGASGARGFSRSVGS